MNEREALKLAFDALDCIYSPLHVREIEKIGNAMKVIKEALTQPEQEPVANGIIRTLISIDKDGIETWKHEPFYTAPPQRKPLTDEEIAKAWAQSKGDILMRLKPFARAIEAAHGIKGE